MAFRQCLGKKIALLLFLVCFPAAAIADMNGQEDKQDKEDLQEDVSANNTAFRGARLLKRGSQAYAQNVKALGSNQSANMFWSGDTLNFEVRSNEGNRVAVKVEFFWFEAGLERGSDFYVAIIRGNSSPNVGGNCQKVFHDTWQLGVNDIAQYVDVKADTTGQGGAIRWDWSVPFQTYRWEPKQQVKVEQHYALNAGAKAKGSVEGSAGMKTPEGKEIQAKGSISGNAGAEASHKVSTNYTLTLYRWQMQVSSGPTGIKWGLMPMDPKKATDNAYHEYYLVLQSESPGQPVIIPEIEFGGTFECPRWSYLPDRTEKLQAKATNIRLSPPPVPNCPEGQRAEGQKCVPKCEQDEEFKEGKCQPKEDDNSCQKDDDCKDGEICDSGSCKSVECTESKDCDSDEICEKNNCRKVECAEDKDCKDGEECTSDGKCEEDEDEEDDKSDSIAQADVGPTGKMDAGFADIESQANAKNLNGGCSNAGGSEGGPVSGYILLLLVAAGAARRMRSPRRSLSMAGMVGIALLVAGCGGNAAPEILPIGDKTVEVEETLEFDVVAKGAKKLEARDLPEGARFDVHKKGEGRFTWSPLISQTGEHSIEFFAKNQDGKSSARMTIEVSGGCQGPEFIGASNWVIRDKDEKLQRSIQVRENHCSKDLEWETEDLPDGMTFTPLVHRATVHWEPSKKQWEKGEYEFKVTVTNDEEKSASEMIVIKLGGECPGASAPDVESTTPSAQQGQNDFPVSAQVTAEDTSNIRDTVLYYATKDDPEAEDFEELDMTRQSDSSDVWESTISLEEDLKHGESVDITYRVCAVNYDDSGDDGCSVQGCTNDLTFTAQMGTAGGLCKSCKRDGDCGGPTDRCVTYSPTSAHCGIDCSSTGSCPTGYECQEVVGGYEQCVRTVDCGGSGEHRAAKSGDLVINELLAHPADDANGDGTTSGTADQFVEIVSVAKEIVDIGKYELQKGHDTRFTFPPGTTVAPGQSVIVFGGGKPTDFKQMGTDLTFSARRDRKDVGMLELRRAGDTVRLADRDGNEVIKFQYGEDSKKMKDAIANDAQSITRAPQVEGTSWVKHKNAPGAGGAAFSPGKTSCGKQYPISVNGGCGGEHCLGRATDKDVKGNDSTKDAVCVSNIPTEIQGKLHYIWQEPKAPGPDPVDYYEVELSSGETIFAGTFPGPTPDVYNTKLQILNGGGRVLKENLHRHKVRDWYSEISSFQAPSSGSYFVRVTTPRGQTELEGSYILRIKKAN